MNPKPTQSKSIRAQLLTAMRDGEYAHCDRLPRESVLSEKLGISRTQLRDILASLDREGFITRRHGVGTIINRHVLGAQARMDIEVEFMDMIRQSGRTPGVAFVRAADGVADEKSGAASWGSPWERPCCGSPGSAQRMAALRFTARIWWRNPSSSGLIRMRSCVSLFSTFLQKVCGLSSYLDLTDLRRVVASGSVPCGVCFRCRRGRPC